MNIHKAKWHLFLSDTTSYGKISQSLDAMELASICLVILKLGRHLLNTGAGQIW